MISDLDLNFALESFFSFECDLLHITGGRDFILEV